MNRTGAEEGRRRRGSIPAAGFGRGGRVIFSVRDQEKEGVSGVTVRGGRASVRLPLPYAVLGVLCPVLYTVRPQHISQAGRGLAVMPGVAGSVHVLVGRWSSMTASFAAPTLVPLLTDCWAFLTCDLEELTKCTKSIFHANKVLVSP